MLERDRIVEIVVAVSSVFVMLATMLWIGFTYSGDNGLSEDGGQLLVVAIVGFILLLTTAGVALAYTLNDPEEGLESDDADADAKSTV